MKINIDKKTLVIVIGILIVNNSITALISPSIADRNGHNAITYLGICENKKLIQTKLIKCMAKDKKCTSLKRRYLDKILNNQF